MLCCYMFCWVLVSSHEVADVTLVSEDKTQQAVFRWKLIRTYEEQALAFRNSTVVYYKSRIITSFKIFKFQTMGNNMMVLWNDWKSLKTQNANQWIKVFPNNKIIAQFCDHPLIVYFPIVLLSFMSILSLIPQKLQILSM